MSDRPEHDLIELADRVRVLEQAASVMHDEIEEVARNAAALDFEFKALIAVVSELVSWRDRESDPPNATGPAG